MKRTTLTFLILLLTLALVGCDGEDEKDYSRDIIGEYGGHIEDSKEELEETFGKLQDAVDEVMKNVPSN